MTTGNCGLFALALASGLGRLLVGRGPFIGGGLVGGGLPRRVARRRPSPAPRGGFGRRRRGGGGGVAAARRRGGVGSGAAGGGGLGRRGRGGGRRRGGRGRRRWRWIRGAPPASLRPRACPAPARACFHRRIALHRQHQQHDDQDPAADDPDLAPLDPAAVLRRRTAARASSPRWPRRAGGGGRSLERISTASSRFNTRPDSWPSPARSGPTVVGTRLGRRLARQRRHAVLAGQVREPALQLRLSDGAEREPHHLLDVDEHLLRGLVPVAGVLGHRLANHAVELGVQPGRAVSGGTKSPLFTSISVS